MRHEARVSGHYTHGSLLESIEKALGKLGKTVQSVAVEDLAPVDEFHIGGRFATAHLLYQLNFDHSKHVLDIGCGLGGAARYISKKLGNQVTGIDLTREYVDTGNTLNQWVGLDHRIKLHHGSALTLPFEDESFAGATMLHVGMNIENKAELFKEVSRVLRPGSCFGVYDVMRLKDGELSYPVPWASEPDTCKLDGPEQYREALHQAGFKTTKENIRADFAIEFFQQMRAAIEEAGGPPPLGLHTLMQAGTADKLKNMVDNIKAGLIAPVEIIAEKL